MNKQLRIVLLLAAAIACGSLGVSSAQDATPQTAATLDLPSPAPPPGAPYPNITEINMNEMCRWQRGAQRYYPERAMQRGVEGLAVLDCVIGADGKMQTCQVLHESPRGFDFGDAATRIACGYQVNMEDIAPGAATRGVPAGSEFYRRDAEGEPWRARTPIAFRLGR
jgi:TonB family protein